MATGAWLAGILYDHFGYYGPSFAAGVGFNIFNLTVIGALVSARNMWRRNAALAPTALGIGAGRDPERRRSLIGRRVAARRLGRDKSPPVPR